MQPQQFPLVRVGVGYDVHRLVEGLPLILGGVAIPFNYGLKGHSDADVLVHAVCDALLGAAALGDLGGHFPDTDEEWAGADSLDLMEQVVALVHEQDYRIANVDASIVLERPKLQTYIPSMRENMARSAQAPTNAISVKATTSEQLGFVGREEGVAVHAVCMLSASGMQNQ